MLSEKLPYVEGSRVGKVCMGGGLGRKGVVGWDRASLIQVDIFSIPFNCMGVLCDLAFDFTQNHLEPHYL